METINKTLGSERLGSGGKMKVALRNYERSNHDLSYIWTSSMAVGTLTPFMSEIMLPGDTFDINLDCDATTHPTIGPLFGSFKIQLDVFKCPFRLYIGSLYMNKKQVGMNMSVVKIPQIKMWAERPRHGSDIDNDQINPSCIYNYLGIRGLVGSLDTTAEFVFRDVNAIPTLMYWDTYGEYYANKMEKLGWVIHNDLSVQTLAFEDVIGSWYDEGNDYRTKDFTEVTGNPNEDANTADVMDGYGTQHKIVFNMGTGFDFDPDRIIFYVRPFDPLGEEFFPMAGRDVFTAWEFNADTNEMTASGKKPNVFQINVKYNISAGSENVENSEPKMVSFDLKNLDKIKGNIISKWQDNEVFEITEATESPFGLPLKAVSSGGKFRFSKRSPMEGLGLKTYQSDLFNNWIDKDTVGGENGINELTKIDTTDGGFTIDQFLVKKKVYDILNRVAVSGGSYHDWNEVTYGVDNYRTPNVPTYEGGLIKELRFQQVISNAGTQEQPLGTLAGRGVMGDKHKGGKIVVKTTEACYVMGIISITPRICYTQGNKWDIDLKNMDNLHKPHLDGIGFEDLLTDRMAYWDSKINVDEELLKFSVGKQPAWINYTTNVDRAYGNFARQNDQMFMILARRYEPKVSIENGNITYTIKDLTTYVDPVKFNHIFSYTRRDAQNFWVQVGVNIQARRKMSAFNIPNL